MGFSSCSLCLFSFFPPQLMHGALQLGELAITRLTAQMPLILRRASPPASAMTPTTTQPTRTTRYASSMSASAYSTLAPMDALRAPPSAAQRGPATRSPATTTATLTPTLAALENFGMSTNNIPETLNWQ